MMKGKLFKGAVFDKFMAKSNLRPKRKVSGTVYVDLKKKKLRDLARNPTFTKVGEKKVKTLRVRAGKRKDVLLSSNEINVYNPKTKKYKKIKIKNVLENPANRHFVRRNILTKGTVVDTELGKAKIVSRPGQQAVVNAVLV
jgi:small subunit ribosomal protein S8e